MARPKVRDNVGRFRKYAAIYIKKELANVAKEYERDITKIVSEKLENTYKDNLIASYSPRSEAKHPITYEDTHTLEDAIHSVVEDNVVKIKIEDVPYKDSLTGRTTLDVYDYLRQEGGTHPSEDSMYPFKHDGETIFARNYPTEYHPFEEHTYIQMKAFIDSLKERIKRGEYNTKKYLKKK